MTLEYLGTKIIIRVALRSEMNWDFLVSIQFVLARFPPRMKLGKFFSDNFLRWHTYILKYTILYMLTPTRAYLFPVSLMNTSYFYSRGLLQRETAEQGIRRDRISVVGVFHVTRQMRRWRVPVRNSSLARCPPAEMPAVWKSRGNIPSNSAATRRKLISVKCGKCESTDKVSYHFAIQIMHGFHQLRC